MQEARKRQLSYLPRSVKIAGNSQKIPSHHWFNNYTAAKKVGRIPARKVVHATNRTHLRKAQTLLGFLSGRYDPQLPNAKHLGQSRRFLSCPRHQLAPLGLCSNELYGRLCPQYHLSWISQWTQKDPATQDPEVAQQEFESQNCWNEIFAGI